MMRWIGAVLILTGCGGFGFSLAAEHHRRERLVHQLLRGLKIMQWELQYRLTPLPELCRIGAKQAGGVPGQVLLQLAQIMEQQLYPDVSSCMQEVLTRQDGLPRSVRMLFRQLGTSLGRYDLPGQLEGLEAVYEGCKEEIRLMAQNREQRLRSYRTLGLCAGAALAIILV